MNPCDDPLVLRRKPGFQVLTVFIFKAPVKVAKGRYSPCRPPRLGIAPSIADFLMIGHHDLTLQEGEAHKLGKE